MLLIFVYLATLASRGEQICNDISAQVKGLISRLQQALVRLAKERQGQTNPQPNLKYLTLLHSRIKRPCNTRIAWRTVVLTLLNEILHCQYTAHHLVDKIGVNFIQQKLYCIYVQYHVQSSY